MAGNKQKLIIVESPAKARTISKFLGKGYKVVASKGHVRDLPKSTFGIDIEDNFSPKYINLGSLYLPSINFFMPLYQSFLFF